MIMEVKSKYNLPKRLYVCGTGLYHGRGGVKLPSVFPFATMIWFHVRDYLNNIFFILIFGYGEFRII